MATPPRTTPRRTESETGGSEVPLDYSLLEDLDPSLVGGFELIYEREVPFELRSASVDVPTEIGALEAIKVRILTRSTGEQLEEVKVELVSESNLFFHYQHELDLAAFEKMQESQRLMMEFADYPTVLLRMLNQCIREPHIHLVVFVMQPTGEARLDFLQNMEYKFVELLSTQFFASDEDVVRTQVSYRYNVVKARMQLLQARLSDINQMVKIKNPSLLLQLQRTPPKFPASMPGAGGGGVPAMPSNGSLAIGGGRAQTPPFRAV